MQLLFLALFGIGLFGLMTFLRRWADSFVMIAFGIGCIVNSNIFYAYTCGFQVGNMIFAVDSILYTMFIHLVAVKYLHYSKREGKLFVYSSLVAVIISALFEFFANMITNGFNVELLEDLFCYFVSVIGSLAGILVMTFFFKYTQKKKISNYIALPIGIAIACFINTGVYYLCCSFIIRQVVDVQTMIGALLGSIVGKAYAIVLAEISYFLNSEKLWCPLELIALRSQKKEEELKNKNKETEETQNN